MISRLANGISFLWLTTPGFRLRIQKLTQNRRTGNLGQINQELDRELTKKHKTFRVKIEGTSSSPLSFQDWIKNKITNKIKRHGHPELMTRFPFAYYNPGPVQIVSTLFFLIPEISDEGQVDFAN